MTTVAEYNAIVAKAMLEKTLQERVRQLALAHRWRFFHVHNSRHSPAGFPDCTLVRGVRLIFAELKRETGKVTAEQQAWLDDLARASVETYVFRPSDLLDGTIDAVLRGPA